jgi:hypothetical protein
MGDLLSTTAMDRCEFRAPVRQADRPCVADVAVGSAKDYDSKPPIDPEKTPDRRHLNGRFPVRQGDKEIPS